MPFDDDAVADIGDQTTVDNASKEAARREAEDMETVKVWMSHPKGRDLLFRIISERCHVGQTFIAFDVHGQTDTHRTFLDLGERNIGMWLDGELRRHPELYMKMLAEQRTDREASESRIRKQNEKKDPA